jgi:hypothetical protein
LIWFSTDSYFIDCDSGEQNFLSILAIIFIDVITNRWKGGEEEKGIEKKCENRRYITNVDLK